MAFLEIFNIKKFWNLKKNKFKNDISIVTKTNKQNQT